MASSFNYRFKQYYTAYNVIIVGQYQFQVSRFKFDGTEFTLINNRNMYSVYVLFLENDDEIINQMPKDQLVTKVLDLLEQLPDLYQANIFSLMEFHITPQTM